MNWDDENEYGVTPGEGWLLWGLWAFGILLIVLWVLSLLASCSPATPVSPLAPAAPVGTWAVTQFSDGAIYEVNTVTGHGYILMPEGVIDLGTPSSPILHAVPRFGVTQSPTQSPPPVTPDSRLEG